MTHVDFDAQNRINNSVNIDETCEYECAMCVSAVCVDTNVDTVVNNKIKFRSLLIEPYNSAREPIICLSFQYANVFVYIQAVCQLCHRVRKRMTYVVIEACVRVYMCAINLIAFI